VQLVHGAEPPALIWPALHATPTAVVEPTPHALPTGAVQLLHADAPSALY
jgi:hypothetical protein